MGQMTVQWRRLRAGEVDHEALWSAVIGTGGVVGVVWLILLGPPPIGCPFKTVSGLPCPTCGFGRALMALWSGDVTAAFRFNPAAPTGVLAGIGYFAYAAAVVLAGAPRLRISTTPFLARLFRFAALLSVATIWIWLLVDGR
jgi:hypothetical protein